MFFAVAGAMILAAGLALALPLWRAGVKPMAGAAAANREVHAARIAELEQDLETGRLSTEDHAAAQRDLEADLAAAGADEPASRGVQPRRVTAGIIFAGLLALAGSLYWFYGNWRVGAEGVDVASREAVLQMVADLATRLQTPEGKDDLKGWEMLGHSYMIMGRYGDALQAFSHARELTRDADPEVLAAYAEAVTLAEPDLFMDKAAPLFEKVLTLQPANVQALWYGGLAAEQRGDKALAVKRWNGILAQDPPADYRAYISRMITEAGGTPTTAAATGIRLRLSLAAALAAKLSPDAAVFVYARPKGQAGGPPLAARRLKLSELPADISLSDQDSVMPGRVLSAYGDVVVSARVSKTGTAEPHAGDLMGQGEWKKASDEPLAIVIDTVVR
ncbi:MAG TPA: c-type cytochrome biogenesis protein CcmI [Gammaproteobacteria bacterium]